jgi:hypothetical protein
MSNFEPYSAGDHFAWQQAQQQPLSAPNPSASSREWDLKRHLHAHPGTPALIRSMTMDVLRSCREQVEFHVTTVEFRGGALHREMVGRANAFEVVPIGTLTVKGRYDDRFQGDLAVRADGRCFLRTPQDANVEMSPYMRWREPEVRLSDSFVLGTIALRLHALLPVHLRPDLDEALMQPGPPREPVDSEPTNVEAAKAQVPRRPVSKRARRRAATIRSNNMRTAIAASDLASILERTQPHGPLTRAEKKMWKDLKRLRAKSDRAHAKANALDGGQ